MWIFLIVPYVVLLPVHVFFLDWSTWHYRFATRVRFLAAHVPRCGNTVCSANVRPRVGQSIRHRMIEKVTVAIVTGYN